MSWDTIVVGSGIAGMCAAVALARNGQRVLVLEQHYLPGGWTQSFTLDQYRFSPGVHYIGDLHEGGGVRRILEGLGLTRDLEFCELSPDGYDHVLVGSERFDIPSGFARYFERLVERFPGERDGLRRYFDTLHAVTLDVQKCDHLLSFPEVLTVPFRAPSLMRYGFTRLAPLLERRVRDPFLRGVLSAQCGNHGLAPSRVALPVHAVMVEHYLNGGYYPRGGAKAIPSAMIKELRRHGGKIRTRARVAEILVERGRAVGVVLEDGERIDASFVVSNADPAVTFGRLVKSGDGAAERRRARRMEYSAGMISVFCAVELDLRGRGYDSGNYWWFRTPDVGGAYERMERELPGDEVDGLFLTITTLKNPEELRRGRHTLEMFTYVPYEPFEKWRGAPQGQRGEEYERFKRALGDKMLRAAENVIPGLRKAIRFVEVGTPLTNEFYCESVLGAALGTAKTPFQIGPFSFQTRSSIRSLYSCGASTLSHGVGGAAISGVIAAQHVLGRASRDDVLGPADGSLRIHPAGQLPPLERSRRNEPSPSARWV
ncbi:MAG TPA: NAD(P)/FAD-dependent oxidoreductase [Polyangiaceae bacterium]|nr:NAD(P)/FAD-dependent oxidoreductase [Polyangiaceae bacterium]